MQGNGGINNSSVARDLDKFKKSVSNRTGQSSGSSNYQGGSTSGSLSDFMDSIKSNGSGGTSGQSGSSSGSLSDFMNSVKTNGSGSTSGQSGSSSGSLSDFMNSIKQNGPGTSSGQSGSSSGSLSDFMNTIKSNGTGSNMGGQTVRNHTINVPKVNASSGMKKAVLWIAVAALAVFLITQFAGGDKLSGTTWRYTYDAGSYTLYSFSNGTVNIIEINTITGTRNTDTAKYKIKGNKIDFEPGDKNVNWEISGKQLILRRGSSELVLIRE